MATSVDIFDYPLPPDRIAQEPASPRETARLMVVDRANGTIIHEHVGDLPKHFRQGDVIVVNDSKVFRARQFGNVTNPDGTHRTVELFLVRPSGETAWLALGKPGKRIAVGARIDIAPSFSASVLDKLPDGTLIVDFGIPAESVMALADRYGHVPVPPYIKREPDASEYQTAYADRKGSVAAPTAGFHLTPAILATFASQGVEVVRVTLHVGLGTFMPMKTDTLETHSMHTEWVRVTADAAAAVMRAKQEGRRVIAIGTTSVRTLEGVAALHDGKLTAFEGDVGLFITPGYRFSVVDCMLTNFHLPKSTLIVLVSAFAGTELIRQAYREAIERGYRFYSFGDAMLIV